MTWFLSRSKKTINEGQKTQKTCYRSSMSLLMDIPGFKQASSLPHETSMSPTSGFDEINDGFPHSYLDEEAPPWPPRDLYEYYVKSKPSRHSTDDLPRLVWKQIASQSDDVRVKAIDMLGMYRDHTNDRVFIQALHDEYWEVRAAAAQALGELEEQTFAPLLLEALQSEPDFTVRQSLVRALGKCRQQKSIKILISLLCDQNENWQVREAATWSLGKFGRTIPIWPLINALCSDPDETVRAAAACALGEIEHPSARSMLAEVMAGDEDEDVREAAMWAFKQLENKEKWPRFFRTLRAIQRNWLFFPPLRQKEKPFKERGDNSQIIHKKVLFALLRFIRNKTGFVSYAELVHGNQQPTLFLSYCYQQTGPTLRDEVIPQFETLLPIKPLESVFADHHELLQGVQRQVAELQSSRQWHETLLIILELHAPETGPTRAVLCGIGCHAVRSSDPLILDQLLRQWRSYYQNAQELSHIQIGYQSCDTSQS